MPSATLPNLLRSTTLRLICTPLNRLLSGKSGTRTTGPTSSFSFSLGRLTRLLEGKWLAYISPPRLQKHCNSWTPSILLPGPGRTAVSPHREIGPNLQSPGLAWKPKWELSASSVPNDSTQPLILLHPMSCYPSLVFSSKELAWILSGHCRGQPRVMNTSWITWTMPLFGKPPPTTPQGSSCYSSAMWVFKRTS